MSSIEASVYKPKFDIPKAPPKVEAHRMICNRLNQTYATKNHDYGDSFAQLRNRQPNAILVRLFDKYLRLETLLSGEKAQVNESIDDTLIDLANYAIMELVERKQDAEKKTTADTIH